MCSDRGGRFWRPPVPTLANYALAVIAPNNRPELALANRGSSDAGWAQPAGSDAAPSDHSPAERIPSILMHR
jgi:hypothetical protein